MRKSVIVVFVCAVIMIGLGVANMIFSNGSQAWQTLGTGTVFLAVGSLLQADQRRKDNRRSD